MSDSKVARRRPIIRKQSISNKLKSYPFDLFLWLNEIRSSIDWDEYCDTLATPLGYILTSLYLLLSKGRILIEKSCHRRENALFQVDYAMYKNVRSKAINPDMNLKTQSRNESVWLALVNFVLILLFAVSICNSLYVLWSFKDYTLLFTSMDTKPPTPSARKMELSGGLDNSWLDKAYGLFTFSSSKEDDFDSESSDSDQAGSFYEDTTNEINLIDKDVWELHVWNPSKFMLHIMATFSPVSVIIIKLTSNEVATWKLIIIVALMNLTTHFMVARRFLILIKDKQLIYQGMLEEYNRKFVYPKTSILKKDAEIDATFGPDAPAIFTVKTDTMAHVQNSKLKVFITHDINCEPHNSVILEDSMSEEATKFSEHNSKNIDDLNTPGRSPSPRRELYQLRQRMPEAIEFDNKFSYGRSGSFSGREGNELLRYYSVSPNHRRHPFSANDRETSTPYLRRQTNNNLSPFRQSSPFHETRNSRVFHSPYPRYDYPVLAKRDPYRASQSPVRVSPFRQTPLLQSRDRLTSRTPSPKRGSSPMKSKPQWH